jgi:hypothetical protein
VHETDEPNAFVDFLDAEFLAGQHGGDVDPLAMQAEAATSGDDDVTIVRTITAPDWVVGRAAAIRTQIESSCHKTKLCRRRQPGTAGSL